jgi:hypothetical protein
LGTRHGCHRNAAHAIAFDCARHQSGGFYIFDEFAQVVCAGLSTLWGHWSADGLLNRGKAASDYARSGKVIVVRHKARLESGKRFHFVGNENPECGIGARLAPCYPFHVYLK